MIIDFLKTKTSKAGLATALSVVREFKLNESREEYIVCPLIAWAKLEQLEEYLDHLVNDKPLKEDTIEYMKELGL